MPEKTVTLRVTDALQRDVGRGIARVDPKVMEELALTSGDVLQIVGTRKKSALAWPAYQQDYGKRIILMDGYMRRNAGVSIDDKVTIRKIEAKVAQKLTLAPTEPLRIVGGEEYLAQILEGRAMARGDFVPINVMGRKIDLVASETNAMFYSIGGPEIMSKYYGENEERLRDVVKQAQENAPATVFIDELDSVAPKREEGTGEVEKIVV